MVSDPTNNINLANSLIDWSNADAGLMGACDDLDEEGRILIDSSRSGFLAQGNNSPFIDAFTTQAYAQGLADVFNDPTIVDYLPSCSSIGPDTVTAATCQRLDVYLSRTRYKSLVVLAPSRVCSTYSDDTSPLLTSPPYDCTEIAAILDFLDSGGRLFIITDGTRALDGMNQFTNEYINLLLGQLGATTISVDNSSANVGPSGSNGDYESRAVSLVDGGAQLCASNGSFLNINTAMGDVAIANWVGSEAGFPAIAGGNTSPTTCTEVMCSALMNP